MCGIVGYINLEGFDPTKMGIMNDAIRHRGPDDEGYFVSDLNSTGKFLSGPDTIAELQHLPLVASEKSQVRLGLAHRRLSILDLSPSGHQPMVGPSGNLLVYNGEVYNFLEIKKELEGLGHRFQTESDTEVILHAYDQWGPESVSKFIGMWSFCIYDRAKNQLFISRDRFGIKPFYYYHKDGNFIFGSEVKSLVKLPEVDKTHNEKAIFQYFSGGKLGDLSETFYSHIRELPAASNMLIKLDDLSFEINQYYDLEAHSKAQRGEGPFTLEGFKEVFEDAVRIHMRADVEVGSCLSGGLDSSALVYSAEQKNNGRPYKTFSAVFPGESIDESHFIDELLATNDKLIGYRIIPDAKTYWEDLDRLIYHQDFPIASTSMFAQWQVMKLASENGIKVLLDGQGADEILGGYSYFTGSFLLDLMSKGKFGKALSEGGKIKENRGVSPLLQLGRAFSHTLPAGLQGKIRSQQRLGSSFLNQEIQHELDSSLKRHSIKDNYLKHCLEAIEGNLHNLLRYEDRNSMAFSVESRVPFLDHRLVEYSLKMPIDLKIKNAWTKYPLRRMMDKNIPDSIVWRKDKKGFVTPQKNWKKELDTQLSSYLQDNLSSNPFLDKTNVLAALNSENLEGSKLSEIWKLISFVKWYEINK
ncbi:asparagine synthase (glutamine-hydrolyzing) [Schleiferiaceae bacterium]|nr:asparagine synthase (glutamine-hydrolyzing) [Schleiferiaceae bacterium]